MFAKKLTSTAVLISGLVFAGSASAVDVSVEKYVGALVTSAFEVATQEITFGVQESVLSASNGIVMDESELVAAKVTITDLEATEGQKQESSDKAE